MGSDGFVPILIVFGALLQLGLPTDGPKPSTFKNAIALQKETKERSNYFASRQAQQALTSRNGSDVSENYKNSSRHPVLVYRSKIDKWDGSFSLPDIRGEDVMVLTSKEETKFQSTLIKPHVTA